MKNRYLKIFYLFLTILFIFILGVQVGIHHGRQLQLEELGIESIQYH